MDEPCQSKNNNDKIVVKNGEKSVEKDNKSAENENMSTEQGENVATQKDSSIRFRYGNFNRYYGIRIQGLDRDPRLDLLQPDWFHNRAVLDIGCNIGALTLAIAKEFGPRRALGIDIDASLIGVARKNIRHYCDESEELVGKLPASIISNKSSDIVQLKKFPQNIWFQHENYVLSEDYLLEMVRPEFDVILALSITKWVHLNWGDVGLRRFFQRIYRHLQPGGRFILEPQDFSSYGRRIRRKLNEEMVANYRSIQFKPEQFKDYLLSEAVGFESVEELGTPRAKSKGFERKIFVFRKSAVRESENNSKQRKRKRKNGKLTDRETDQKQDGEKEENTEEKVMDDDNGNSLKEMPMEL